MRIEHLGEQVVNRIGLERGYVAESVAADWAISHALSIQKLVADKDSRSHELSDEVAALFVNTMCVAKQYNVNIKEFYRSKKLDANIEKILTVFQ